MASPSDRTAHSEATTTTLTVPAITVPSHPAPLPTHSPLCGAGNWGARQVQMRSLLGIDAWKFTPAARPEVFDSFLKELKEDAANADLTMAYSTHLLAAFPPNVHEGEPLPPGQCRLAGKRYFVTFVHDFSRHLWIEPLDRKSGIFKAFKHFHTATKTKSGCKLQCFCSDNGSEYACRVLRAYLDVTFESPLPYSSASNVSPSGSTAQFSKGSAP
ncbi:hypothetical protein JCM21900_003678 [Sporobolomyces salmonicolor]